MYIWKKGDRVDADVMAGVYCFEEEGRERDSGVKVRYCREHLLQEDYVEVHFQEENERIGLIRNFFSSLQSIVGRKGNEMHKIYPGSIYYLEVVDRKLFAYQEKEVYQLEYSLGQFLDCFAEYGFVRIGKSMAANLYKVGQVKADLNMHLRLLMDNGEVLVLNRTYKKEFMDALRHIQEVCHENH